MASIFKMLPLIIRQNIGRQKLERIPETFSEVTDAESNVVQYDRVMETKLAISYAIAIETIYKARTTPFGGNALDVCCGPGHLAITMARELKLDSLIGIDLSQPMVDRATKNAREKGMKNVTFEHGDATQLSQFPDGHFDLTTMMDAAHHMPSLEVLGQVFQQLDRVTANDGLVVVMDLVRLRTREITESYIELLANDYVERGLPAFKKDFADSMFAAWTPHELWQAIPDKSDRIWYLVVPRGLPFAQFVIGSPFGSGLFHKRKPLWNNSTDVVVTSQNLPDYKIAKLTMATAGRRNKYK